MHAAERTDRLACADRSAGRCRGIGKAPLAARDLTKGTLAAVGSVGMMRSRVGAGRATGGSGSRNQMGGGRCGLASPTLRQKSKRPTHGRQRLAIGGNECRADEERGSCESSREDERRRVPRGQCSATKDVMSADARGNVHERGGAEPIWRGELISPPASPCSRSATQPQPATVAAKAVPPVPNPTAKRLR
jgi:hypothetical protein